MTLEVGKEERQTVASFVAVLTTPVVLVWWGLGGEVEGVRATHPLQGGEGLLRTNTWETWRRVRDGEQGKCP